MERIMLSYFEKVLQLEEDGSRQLVHIGAGICNELPGYIALGFQVIHLVEANPAQVSYLKEKVKYLTSSGVSTVKVHKEIIARESGVVDFYLTNCTFFDGLEHPSVFKADFPNLSVVETARSSAKSLSSFIGMAELEENGKNVIVLDVLGSIDLFLIDSLSELYSNFEFVVVRLVSNAEITKCIQILSDKYFDFIIADSDGEYGQWVFFRRNRFAVEREFLITKVESIESEKTEAILQSGFLKDEIAELTVRISTLKKDNVELVSSIESLGLERSELRSSIDRLERKVVESSENFRSLEKLNGEFNSNVKTLESEKSELKSALGRLENEMVEIAASFELLQKENGALVEADAKSTSQIENLVANVQSLKRENAELATSKKALEKKNFETENNCLKLRNENQELLHCRDLLREEVQRVEAQMDFIKDVVFREKAF
ncbi:hypothetical protein M0G74_08765 [Microbulbifer sp. CAU 1566]|uniref:hypothetical protein n=1 Tax=Microbulbifer sp. CAU 1566 TaxID=2933269 RepID=UPI00200305F7|nr:hypothetical protein [Microbulbifer sp. CAU 1566]MCK7597361.1 hypothetical protein [Microbulbifer sp. CAU 1566]